ncbi:Inositol-tetrakisphosphate 1-kinase 4 [Acorus calamus]|uniref:Inositol-tetrakisphosphate 1-kinase n=1 Tax=Acorus calamus TaxID=4465 RepID=A0AAV9CYR4_ACOCL|nr:Inositol-tetrakisphosphate 1-kinase 4 [Acorus calamus]
METPLFLNRLLLCSDSFITPTSQWDSIPSEKESRGTPIMTVGYVMKPSREEDFLKAGLIHRHAVARGAFPMNPSQNGLMFIPIQMDLPLSYQMPYVDIILHKATDEIIAIDPCASSNFSGGISYSKGMQELKRYIQDHPECCVIDPLDNIHPLLDRFRIQQILLGLEAGILEVGFFWTVRFLNGHKTLPKILFKVSSFSEPNLEGRLSEANLSFPNIVKPQVACGVADAHNMAVVFRAEDFKGLSVPVPAIIQEYVDHGSSIYKFYVLGENVFHATRKSMPNANVLLSSSEENGSAPILFDSLKSLPTSNEGQGSNAGKHSLDVQEGSGDHVIVDVNYLPSFKEIPVSEAIPAFWDAIRSSYDSRKAK